ncbi:unnamed protein product [Penicillium salamii]|uniref:J domain-containing protein n=1 Tax=Penicillium salamii TaxID=1612424 RepID=A0A9W4NPK1_9EURO|nr:unnamed protein product [Penicillium salamii]CAG8387728.1 unnamed protein product [Penicillium salamii]CAG8393028.1 unnamed protein product [Penicillium salamii]CAG8393221.1 unnamed protein product [Penicillium salamii]
MVKSDVRKDYYADLGLQPSAEAEDIKRQFRKLALKYHPDRNPGREIEFNAKFQAIQAANEILSDPRQRLKYDTDRLRAGYGKNYGPARANTQRKTQTPAYPPRPTATPTPSAGAQYTKTPPNGPSAGARRYASHARAGPQQWKPQDNAQTRADAFKGFSNMRGGQSNGWQGFDPSTGRASASTPGPGAQRQPFGASAQSNRPKSAFETFQNAHSHAQSQSTKKKQGFAPGAAGGDEPMARNTSAYSSNSRAERPSSQYYEPAPPPTAKKAPEPEPVRHSYTPDFERHSRSYAQAGKGEKTFFSSAGLGRSQTMRDPSGTTRTNVNTNTSSPKSARSGRHRSASPKARRNPNNYDSTSSSESEDLPKPKAKAVPKSRLRPHQNFADFHRQQNQSPKNGRRPPCCCHLPPGSQFRWNVSQDATKVTVTLVSMQSPQQREHFLSLLNTAHLKNKKADANPKGHASDSAAFPKASYQQSKYPNSSGSSSSINAETGISPERPERPHTTAFGRNSTSDLHKKFSAEDWRKHIEQFDFIGSASPSKENPPSKSPGPQSRGRAGQRNQNPPPTYNQGTTPPQQPSNGSQTPQKPTPFAQAKFSADSWSEQLRNLSWTAPEAEKACQTANSAPPRSPKKQPRAGTKVRSAPQTASVASEADEAKDTINGHTPHVPPATAAPDVGVEEMDIDDDLPAPKHTPPVPGKVPLGRPSSGNFSDAASHPLPESPAKKPRPPPPTEKTTPISPLRPALFNLGNLRNAAPFASTTNGGIENLGDIHTTLPFDSQAKQQTTTQRDIQPRDLDLPNPPKRPWAPKPISISGSTPVLPREKWIWYASAMGAYMHEWNAFNRRMLVHLNVRQEANETGLAPGWISAVSDSVRLKIGVDDENGNDKTIREDSYDADEFLIPGSNKGGFSAYLRGVEEDIIVRKHWDVASEMHRECILDLGRLREWIRNGGKVV